MLAGFDGDKQLCHCVFETPERTIFDLPQMRKIDESRDVGLISRRAVAVFQVRIQPSFRSSWSVFNIHWNRRAFFQIQSG